MSNGSQVSFLFLGNNRQYMLVYAKAISSWIRKVLSFSKEDMSLGTFQGAVVSAALLADVCLVTILQMNGQSIYSS